MAAISRGKYYFILLFGILFLVTIQIPIVFSQFTISCNTCGGSSSACGYPSKTFNQCAAEKCPTNYMTSQNPSGYFCYVDSNSGHCSACPPQPNQPPTCSITGPTSTQSANFPVTINYNDPTSDSNTLKDCRYRVFSSGVQTRGWTSAGSCSGTNSRTFSPTITVGSTGDCKNAGSNTCKVECEAQDWDLKSGTSSRYFSIQLCSQSGQSCTTNANCCPGQNLVCDTVRKVCTPQAPNSPPSVTSVTNTPNPGIVNQPVSFTATTTDPDGDQRQVRWSFDGVMDKETYEPLGVFTKSFTFTTTGTKTVIVQPKDSRGAVGNPFPYTIQINPPPNQPPTCAFNVPAAGSTQTTNFGVSITFTDPTTDSNTLSSCQYRVFSNNQLTRVGTSAGSCSGTNSITLSPTITVGPTSDCRNNGANTCRVECLVFDQANSQGTASRLFSIAYPVCGNGIREGTEACDAGANNGACPRTCSSSTCTINPCPPSVTAVNPSTGLVNQQITYTASASDPNGNQIQLRWSFDGGTTWKPTTGYNALTDYTEVYTYTSAGTKTIKVEPKDSTGIVGSQYTKSVTIFSCASQGGSCTVNSNCCTPLICSAGVCTSPPNSPPSVTNVVPITGTVNQQITYTATATDPNADPIQINWNFGAGWTGFRALGDFTEPYTFTTTGAKTVLVQPQDSKGAPGSIYSKSVTISCASTGQSCASNANCCPGLTCTSGTCQTPNSPPSVTSVSPSSGLTGQAIPFTATATDPNGNPIQLRWSCNGGSTWSSWGANNIFTYTCPAFSTSGAKTIKVEPRDSLLAVGSQYTHTVTINPSCLDECSPSGADDCVSLTSRRTCGNYDADSCLEWGSPSSCPQDWICQQGRCISLDCDEVSSNLGGCTGIVVCGIPDESICGPQTVTCSKSTYTCGFPPQCGGQECCFVEKTCGTKTYDCGNCPPFCSFTSPAAGSTQSANFPVSIKYEDYNGNMNSCMYRVLSNNIVTKTWISAGSCAGSIKTLSPTITVGAASDCRNNGQNTCRVECQVQDRDGIQDTNSRTFSISNVCSVSGQSCTTNANCCPGQNLVCDTVRKVCTPQAPNSPPSVTSVSPSSGSRGQQITFTAQVSDPEGNDIQLRWSCDGGTTWNPWRGTNIKTETCPAFTTPGQKTIKVEPRDTPGFAVGPQYSHQVTISSCNNNRVCEPGAQETCANCGLDCPPTCSTNLDCNDNNALTNDICNTPGTCSSFCTHTCRDNDRDGAQDIACGGTDCNDNNAQIHPGAQEVCDGQDNNCAGGTDEGFLAPTITITKPTSGEYSISGSNDFQAALTTNGCPLTNVQIANSQLPLCAGATFTNYAGCSGTSCTVSKTFSTLPAGVNYLCVRATSQYINQQTTKDVNVNTCYLDSTTISNGPSCSGGYFPLYCEVQEQITATATLRGACPSQTNIQIDATNRTATTCNIQNSIPPSGINIACAGLSCSGTWTISQPLCNKEFRKFIPTSGASSAWLGPIGTGTKLDTAKTQTGSFIYAHLETPEEGTCSGGVDNDGDKLIDSADPDCCRENSNVKDSTTNNIKTTCFPILQNHENKSKHLIGKVNGQPIPPWTTACNFNIDWNIGSKLNYFDALLCPLASTQGYKCVTCKQDNTIAWYQSDMPNTTQRFWLELTPPAIDNSALYIITPNSKEAIINSGGVGAKESIKVDKTYAQSLGYNTYPLDGLWTFGINDVSIVSMQSQQRLDISAVCGNLNCEAPYEDTKTCAFDCGCPSQTFYCPTTETCLGNINECQICGDGLKQSPEACDDANGNNNDACKNDCTLGITPCNNNGQCESQKGETQTNCPQDCIKASGVCGPNSQGVRVCEPGRGEDNPQSPNYCPQDCSSGTCVDTDNNGQKDTCECYNSKSCKDAGFQAKPCSQDTQCKPQNPQVIPGVCNDIYCSDGVCCEAELGSCIECQSGSCGDGVCDYYGRGENSYNCYKDCKNPKCQNPNICEPGDSCYCKECKNSGEGTCWAGGKCDPGSYTCEGCSLGQSCDMSKTCIDSDDNANLDTCAYCGGISGEGIFDDANTICTYFDPIKQIEVPGKCDGAGRCIPPGAGDSSSKPKGATLGQKGYGTQCETDIAIKKGESWVCDYCNSTPRNQGATCNLYDGIIGTCNSTAFKVQDQCVLSCYYHTECPSALPYCNIRLAGAGGTCEPCTQAPEPAGFCLQKNNGFCNTRTGACVGTRGEVLSVSLVPSTPREGQSAILTTTVQNSGVNSFDAAINIKQKTCKLEVAPIDQSIFKLIPGQQKSVRFYLVPITSEACNLDVELLDQTLRCTYDYECSQANEVCDTKAHLCVECLTDIQCQAKGKTTCDQVTKTCL